MVELSLNNQDPRTSLPENFIKDFLSQSLTFYRLFEAYHQQILDEARKTQVFLNEHDS